MIKKIDHDRIQTLIIYKKKAKDKENYKKIVFNQLIKIKIFKILKLKKTICTKFDLKKNFILKIHK